MSKIEFTEDEKTALYDAKYEFEDRGVATSIQHLP